MTYSVSHIVYAVKSRENIFVFAWGGEACYLPAGLVETTTRIGAESFGSAVRSYLAQPWESSLVLAEERGGSVPRY